MTLRVKVSIVPFGNEEKERQIHEINISNLGPYEDEVGWYRYGVEVDKYEKEGYDGYVIHQRDRGPLLLLRKVMDEVV